MRISLTESYKSRRKELKNRNGQHKWNGIEGIIQCALSMIQWTSGGCKLVFRSSYYHDSLVWFKPFCIPTGTWCSIPYSFCFVLLRTQREFRFVRSLFFFDKKRMKKKRIESLLTRPKSHCEHIICDCKRKCTNWIREHGGKKAYVWRNKEHKRPTNERRKTNSKRAREKN